MVAPDLRRSIERPRERHNLDLIGGKWVHRIHPHGIVNGRTQIGKVRTPVYSFATLTSDPFDSESLTSGKRRRKAITTMPHSATDIKVVF
jgi:hypothetical protein